MIGVIIMLITAGSCYRCLAPGCDTHIKIGGLHAILETKTKRKADELTRLMRRDGWPAMCIHGKALCVLFCK